MNRKHVFHLLILILLLPGLPAHAENTGPVALHEVRLTTGYSRSDLIGFNNEDMEIVPAYLLFGFKVNALIGLDEQHGIFQAGIEPFMLPIIGPDEGVSFGIHLLHLQYTYPLSDKFNFYAEIGSGPMYHGVNSFEQGDAGFNFHNTAGGGLQYMISQNTSLNIGYRYSHISNCGTRDLNHGIDSNEILAGLSLFY